MIAAAAAEYVKARAAAAAVPASNL
jgi:hypothetical protein